MKIITWNACCKFREKYSLLSQYDADILVIQECEDPSRSLCQAYRAFSGQYVWAGANKNKGLGIFCKPGLQIDSLNWESRSLSYFLPVRINDSFDLIGVWACKPYIEAIYEYERMHHQKLESNSVILGDFNSNVIWDRLHGKRNQTAVNNALSDKGLLSAYHYLSGEQYGKETVSTFYLHRHIARSYHIDYCYCDPNRLMSLKVLDKEIFLQYSDHLPVEIILK